MGRLRFPYKYLLRLDEDTWRLLEECQWRYHESKARIIRRLIRYYLPKMMDDWRRERYYG